MVPGKLAQWDNGVLTWVVRGKCGGLWEVTGPWIPAGVLEEEVHGVGGVWGYGVGLETRAARLNRTAIEPSSTGVVQIGLKLGVWYVALRQAPWASSCLWLWTCWCFRWWIICWGRWSGRHWRFRTSWIALLEKETTCRTSTSK